MNNLVVSMFVKKLRSVPIAADQDEHIEAVARVICAQIDSMPPGEGSALVVATLAMLTVGYQKTLNERDAARREADTLAETLRLTQARCTELVEELRQVKAFFDGAYVDSAVIRRRIACDIERILVGEVCKTCGGKRYVDMCPTGRKGCPTCNQGVGA
jgi:hypothetical protein